MGTFFVYILKSSVCLALFYLFYRLLLSKETFHRFNRVALLGILFLSLLIPLLEVTTAQPTEMAHTMLTLEQLLAMVDFYSQDTVAVAPVEVKEITLSGIQITLVIYLAGIVFSLAVIFIRLSVCFCYSVRAERRYFIPVLGSLYIIKKSLLSVG